MGEQAEFLNLSVPWGGRFLSARELAGYVWIWWCLGHPDRRRWRSAFPGENKTPSGDERQWDVLQALLMAAVGPSVPARGAVVFQRRNQAVRCTSDFVELPDIRAVALAKKNLFLFAGKPFHLRLARATRQVLNRAGLFAHWRQGALRVAAYLTEEELVVLDELLPDASAASVPFRGAVILAHQKGEGTFWIGLRQLPPPGGFGSADERTLKPAAVARWFATAAGSILPCPSPGRLEWLEKVAPNLSLTAVFRSHPEEFRRCCRALVESVIPVSDPAVAKDRDGGVPSVNDGTVFGEPGPAAIWLAPLLVEESTVTTVLAADVAAFLANARRHESLMDTVVLCTNLSYAAVAGALQALPALHEERVGTIRVLDEAGLLDLLSHAPWVWSQYVARTGPVRVARGSDREALESLLLHSPLRASCPIEGAPVRPEISQMDLVTPLIFFVGRPGSGKSTVDRTGFSWTGDKTSGVQGGSYAEAIQGGLGGRDRSRRRGRVH